LSPGKSSPVLRRLPEKALFPGAQYRFVLNVSDTNNPSRREQKALKAPKINIGFDHF
jgi:hypothetical protein